MRNVLCTLACAVVGLSACAVEFHEPATAKPQIWTRWEFPVEFDAVGADGVQFDFFCDNLSRFRQFVIDFVSAKGPKEYYRYTFEAPAEGKWAHVRLHKAELPLMRLVTSPGWDRFVRIRLNGVKGLGTGEAKVAIRNIEPLRVDDPEALQVVSDGHYIRNPGLNKWWKERPHRVAEAFGRLGIRLLTVLEGEVPAEIPASVKVLVLPVNPELPDGFLAKVGRFIDRGGKVILLRGVNKELEKMVKARKAGLSLGPVLWPHDDHGDSFAAFLKPRLVGLVPSFADTIAAKEAADVRHREENLKRAKAFPSQKDRFRSISCHSAYADGLFGGGGWDAGVKFLKDMGFTSFGPNLCTGPVAYYESDVLMRAKGYKGDAFEEVRKACEKYGLDLCAWRVCWRMPEGQVPKEFIDRCVAEGRVQVTVDGKVDRQWLCPSHPENRRQETAAFVELVRKGAKIISYDYIRFPGPDHCFCDRCRALFEQRIGTKVGKWPEDVRCNDTHTQFGEHYEAWSEFRRDLISSLVHDTTVAMRRVNPKVVTTAGVFPNPYESRSSEGQDWLRWCREGWLDIAGMMLNPNSMGDSYRAMIREERKLDVAPAYIRPTVYTSCWPEETDFPLMTSETIKAIREEGYDAFSYFQLDKRALELLPILRQGVLAD